MFPGTGEVVFLRPMSGQRCPGHQSGSWACLVTCTHVQMCTVFFWIWVCNAQLSCTMNCNKIRGSSDQWGPTFWESMPQISPSPSLSATPIPFLGLTCRSAFSFLQCAPCPIYHFAFYFWPFLPLCCLSPPQSAVCHTEASRATCARLGTPALDHAQHSAAIEGDDERH